VEKVPDEKQNREENRWGIIIWLCWRILDGLQHSIADGNQAPSCTVSHFHICIFTMSNMGQVGRRKTSKALTVCLSECRRIHPLIYNVQKLKAIGKLKFNDTLQTFNRQTECL